MVIFKPLIRTALHTAPAISLPHILFHSRGIVGRVRVIKLDCCCVGIILQPFLSTPQVITPNANTRNVRSMVIPGDILNKTTQTAKPTTIRKSTIKMLRCAGFRCHCDRKRQISQKSRKRNKTPKKAGPRAENNNSSTKPKNRAVIAFLIMPILSRY